MLRFSLFALLTLAASPALAAATAWQEIAPGVRARLISSGAVADGKTLAGLEIDMPAATKTYWRTPGETGIPTEFDFAASRGIGTARILWPFPEIDRSQGYLDYVYHGPTVLPVELEIENADTAVLDVALTLGICAEMCVPASARFELRDLGASDPPQALRLAQAEALAPIAWDGAAAPFGAVRLAADGSGLDLADPDAGIHPDALIADAGDPAVLFDLPQKSPDAAIWHLPLLGGTGGATLVGQAVQLTFMTDAGAYWIDRTVEPALR